MIGAPVRCVKHALQCSGMNRRHRPESLAVILATERGGLARLVRRAARLQQATALVQAGLPRPIAEHCEVAVIDAEAVVVQTDASVWASRLRFMHAEVLAAVTPLLEGRPPRRVKVTVRPPLTAAGPTRARRLPAGPTAEAARDLVLAAEGLSDPQLGAALRRLARRTHP